MIEYLIIALLLMASALFSGLTLGLMSLSALALKRKKSLGNVKAAKVYTVRKDGNLLLTTLLIGNVAVNAVLSIYLGSIASGVVAAFSATVLIVVFGEIMPQAVFSRYALTLGAKTAWLVRILIFILYPVTKPIALLLDKTLGEEIHTFYTKGELIKIIEEHEDATESAVTREEEKIVKGALTFSDKVVREIMTPRTVMQTLESKVIIDKNLLEELKNSPHSRIPIYDENIDNMIGVLRLVQLLGDSCMGKTVGSVVKKNIVLVDENKELDHVLNDFLKMRLHLFVVQNEFGGVTGLITLEDVLEEILSSEIMDEADRYKDLRAYAKEKKRK